MKLMERRYTCANGVIERTRFLVGDNTRPRRGKTAKTTERKQEGNERQAIRKAARILNCNASHERSLLIGLSYTEETLEELIAGLPEEQRDIIRRLKLREEISGRWEDAPKARQDRDGLSEEVEKALRALRDAADKKLRAWLRRLRKLIPAAKGLWVTSDTDDKTRELVRVHHHFVLFDRGEATLDEIERAWGCGSVDFRRMRGRDYTPLAVYLLRQAPHGENEKKYHTSRGLVEPKVEERIVIGCAEMRIPPRAVTLERTAYDASAASPVQYARYILPTRQGKIRKDGRAQDEVPQNARDQAEL